MAIKWFNDYSGGINNNTPGLLGDNETEMNINVSQAQAANIAHRLGSELFLDSLHASNPIRGLHMYQKEDDNNYFHTVCSGNLYVNGVGTWSSQESSVWDAASEIDMVNYVNRHYMASSTASENLRYATDSGATTVAALFTATASTSSTGSTLVISENKFSEFIVGFTIHNITDGTSRTVTGYTNPTTVTVNSAINDTWDSDSLVIYLDPRYLAVNGAYMLMMRNSVFPRRSYFTNVDSQNTSLATDFFITNTPPTGGAAFGNGRSFVIFTKNDYSIVDPAQPLYVTPVDGFGCVSHRSIVSIKGHLIYLGKDTFYDLPTNSSTPNDLARAIKNDVTGDALFNQVDRSNMNVYAAGQIGDYYYCAVRDLAGTVKGQTIESAVFVIDLSQNNWKVETYPNSDIGAVFAQFTNSDGETNLYAGSYSHGGVYKLGVMGVYTDDDSTGTPQTVTATTITKHYEISVEKETVIPKLWFKYSSASGINVSYSINGSSTYTALETLPAYTAGLWSVDSIDLGEPLRTISLKLTYTGNTIIYGIGYSKLPGGDEGIKGL